MITTGGPIAPGGATGRRRHGTAQQAAERREMTEEERKKARDEAEKQLEELGAQPPAMVDFTLFFDDWREVDGIKFPHKMRRAMGGATTEEWTISKVKVNPKIDPKKFDRLKGALERDSSSDRARARSAALLALSRRPRRWRAAPADRHAPRRRQGPERRGHSRRASVQLKGAEDRDRDGRAGDVASDGQGVATARTCRPAATRSR